MILIMTCLSKWIAKYNYQGFDVCVVQRPLDLRERQLLCPSGTCKCNVDATDAALSTTRSPVPWRALPLLPRRDHSSCLLFTVTQQICLEEMVIPIRLAEKRICRDCRTGAPFDSDDRTLSSRPTVNIAPSLYSYQSRWQSVA